MNDSECFSVRSFRLYRNTASGAGKEEVLLAGLVGGSDDWSRDGQFLMYTAMNSKVTRELWVLPADAKVVGERTASPFLQTDFNTRQGQFSPDSRFVAYMSDESGNNEVYVRPFPTPADSSLRWKISSGGGTQPRWRADGKELFYISPEGLKAVEMSLAPVFKAGCPRRCFGLPSLRRRKRSATRPRQTENDF
jgi:Tol biopolymer transport system component